MIPWFHWPPDCLMWWPMGLMEIDRDVVKQVPFKNPSIFLKGKLTAVCLSPELRKKFAPTWMLCQMYRRKLAVQETSGSVNVQCRKIEWMVENTYMPCPRQNDSSEFRMEIDLYLLIQLERHFNRYLYLPWKLRSLFAKKESNWAITQTQRVFEHYSPNYSEVTTILLTLFFKSEISNEEWIIKDFERMMAWHHGMAAYAPLYF